MIGKFVTTRVRYHLNDIVYGGGEVKIKIAKTFHNVGVPLNLPDLCSKLSQLDIGMWWINDDDSIGAETIEFYHLGEIVQNEKTISKPIEDS